MVLEPELGGWIDGEIVLPADASVSAEFLEGVALLLLELEQSGTWSHAQNTPPEGLMFQFHGLRPFSDYRIEIVSERLYAAPIEIPRIEPGQRMPVALETRSAVTVEGRVVDEHGVPQPEVDVRASNAQGTFMVKTGADGTFRQQGLSPGSITLRANALGFRSSDRSARELLASGDGEVVSGIELVLERGLQISGHVLWPDGSPAKARVKVGGEGQLPPYLAFATKEDGSFEALGLVDGRYRIEALATHTEELREPGSMAGKERTKKKRSTWRATAEGVAAGTSGLMMTLDPGFALTGIVRDDLGAPLEDFWIEARLGFDDAVLQGSFEDAGGAFVLTGFQPGSWSVVASAKGHAQSTPARVEVPEDVATLELVAPRVARIEGLVVDPSGKGVAEAQVLVMRSGDAARAWQRERARTDDGGRFVLEEVAPGSISLQASSGLAAPSEPRAFELEPAAVLTNVELRLRRGGRITGEVVDARGRGLAGRDVEVWGSQPGWQRTARSDEQGRFAIEHLPAGTFHVASEPTREEILALGGDERGRQNLIPHPQQVELGEEETKHVVLAPTLLRRGGTIEGRVRGLDDAALAGRVWIQVFDERHELVAMERADATGAFRIEGVPPGTVQVAASGEGLVCRSPIPLEIAAERTARAELELVRGTQVRALILDARGAPVAVEGLELVTADGSTRPVSSSGDGSAWIGLLPPGAYTLRGSHLGVLSEREFQVSGEPETTVELRLE